MSKSTKQQIEDITSSEYQYGFTTKIKEERIPNGLNEEIIKTISAIKNEPDWLLEWRLKAYNRWLKMEEPKWSELDIEPIFENDYHLSYQL